MGILFSRTNSTTKETRPIVVENTMVKIPEIPNDPKALGYAYSEPNYKGTRTRLTVPFYRYKLYDVEVPCNKPEKINCITYSPGFLKCKSIVLANPNSKIRLLTQLKNGMYYTTYLHGRAISDFSNINVALNSVLNPSDKLESRNVTIYSKNELIENSPQYKNISLQIHPHNSASLKSLKFP